MIMVEPLFNFNNSYDNLKFILLEEKEYKKQLPDDEYNNATTFYNEISHRYIDMIDIEK